MRRVKRLAGHQNHGMAVAGTTPRPGIWVMVAAAVVTVLAFVMPAPAQAVPVAATGRVAVTTSGADGVALDVVILVDESGSETLANVADERQAAGTIAQTMLNPASRVTVIEFGGVNHVVPNQDPVDVVCQPTIASTAVNLAYLSQCVDRLHRRTEAEGDDTDYAAALGQAMSYFNPETPYGKQSPAAAIKVVLMMTDSGLDVHRDTEQYGQNWLLGEQTAVNAQLRLARRYGVQVWPLGFGTGLTSADQIYLNYLAANGAQNACDTRQVSQPRYQVVTNPSDVVDALNQLYAEAGCLGTSVASPVRVGGGAPTTLQVTIPPIASHATISVDRGDPGVQVSFYQPDGSLWTDASAISGQASAVVVLHLANLAKAEVGTWQIRLEAPPGLPSQPVSATAFWQGGVRAEITTEPPSAAPGQPIGVTLFVLGPDGPITDPATLAGLQVRVSASGDGLPGPTPVPLFPGPSAAAGEYQGSFTAPPAVGTLTFTGTTAGYGLYVTEVVATVPVGSGAAAFNGSVRLPAVSTVQAGASLKGNVVFANNTGATRVVRLSLSASHADATITSPAGTIQVPPGNSVIPFAVTFNLVTPLGDAWLEVEAVDAANPGIVYGAGTAVVTVLRPAGFLARYLWTIIGALILIVLVLLAIQWRWAARRRKLDVRGLGAIIRRNGRQLGPELRAPQRRSETFYFVIRDENEPTARLEYPRPEDHVYNTRRSRAGQVKVMTPGGEWYDVAVGGPGTPLPSGLWLAFRDTSLRRPRSVGGKIAPDVSSASDHEPAPQATPLTASPDDWL